MANGMTLKSFYIPNWMARELKMLSFAVDENQSELVRRMVNHGLVNSWATMPPNNAGEGEPRIIAEPVPDRSDVSDESRRALERV